MTTLNFSVLCLQASIGWTKPDRVTWGQYSFFASTKFSQAIRQQPTFRDLSDVFIGFAGFQKHDEVRHQGRRTIRQHDRQRRELLAGLCNDMAFRREQPKLHLLQALIP